MRRYILLSIVLFFMSISSFGQKDINAWKKEPSLEQQFGVFKENLNYWDGKYFLTGTQLDEFYNALTDSVSVLENNIAAKADQIKDLQNELSSTSNQLDETKAELETSIKNQNAISVFGQKVDKSVYTLIMSLLILALLVFLGVIFMLYKRSHKVTMHTKKDYDELKEEFEIHKKNALERYTKINMELHRTRMEMNKR